MTGDPVDDYIRRFPDRAQGVLQVIRGRIHSAVPGGGETISYDMPTVTFNGRSLVHFAGWKQHVSLYPAPDGDPDFERDIAPYRSGKSTVKFSYDRPIPVGLIERLVTLLLEQRHPADSS